MLGIFIFYFFATLRISWDLSSRTADRTHGTAMEAQSPKYWTDREFLILGISRDHYS